MTGDDDLDDLERRMRRKLGAEATPAHPPQPEKQPAQHLAAVERRQIEIETVNDGEITRLIFYEVKGARRHLLQRFTAQAAAREEAGRLEREGARVKWLAIRGAKST